MITQQQRVHNFYAGPATMPLEALTRAQAELLDFEGTGMSVMEISHRSKEYLALHEEAKALVRELMRLPSNYHVLFLQGGASLQFGMVPMNLLGGDRSADYLVTGDWAKKALKEAKLFGKTHVAYSSEGSHFDRVPQADGELSLTPGATYVHLTSNNTIFGTQFHRFPDTRGVPLVADMSSDIMWRPFDVTPFGLIYAGAQKNLGPSGVVLVIIRDDLLAQCNEGLTTMLSYPTHVKNDSLYNTPPTFGVYMLRNVLAWLKGIGGLEEAERRNQAKAKLLYDVIDAHPGLYQGHAQPDSRSTMNVTWRLSSEDLEKAFLKGAEERDLVGLKGHRSVGGCRASIYNAMSLESVQLLADYMVDFARQNA
ncbi:MAG TPA: 3-phosphoserine/phosphohydroxythreonine transaminase [Stenomitos sp.]